MELEAAIFADPDNADAWLVYGDWLQSQNDPRGELVTVQASLADTSDPALEKREAELLEKHKEAWLSETLAERADEGELTVTWRNGFFETIAVGGDEGGEASSVEVYEAIAGLTSSKFLHSLEFNALDADDGAPDYDALLDALVAHGLPRSLRRLAFDVKGFQISWSSLGDLSKLYPQLGQLDELRIKIGRMELGMPNLPSLESLEIVTGGFSRGNMQSILAGRWPKLERLHLYFGDDNYGGDCTIDDVVPLLDGQCIPKVVDLGLCNAGFSDAIVAALAGSKVLRQLRSLDLSQGTLGEEGAETLLANAAAFAHLKWIKLDENYIPDALGVRLKEAFGDPLFLGVQGDASPDDRYVQIAE